jgi:dTDP-4-amino-4,6-dideoxygalactose transaminase
VDCQRVAISVSRHGDAAGATVRVCSGERCSGGTEPLLTLSEGVPILPRPRTNHRLFEQGFFMSPLPTSVPLLDVLRDQQDLRSELLAAMTAVLDSGRYLHGPEVRQLEERIAADCGVRHAIGCASGSDAILLGLMALGIGEGDEVIVPSFTFFATASAVSRVGAKIVFVDIDPVTFTMDAHAFAAAITKRTKAVIPVHLYGQCAEIDAIFQIAQPHGIHVIEDAAQSIQATCLGRPAGAWGTLGCLSFYPTKNLGGCGDGGMMTTHDDSLAERLRLFAAHGMSPRYYHKVIGINSRLDTLQAAALLVKHQRLTEWTRQRQRNAKRYLDLFTAAGVGDDVQLPTCDPRNEHVWNQYTIRVSGGRRDALRQYLAHRGIGTEVYYPLPLHCQECFRDLGYEMGSLPETERAAAEVLSLPIFPGLRLDEQQAVVQAVREFCRARQPLAA